MSAIFRVGKRNQVRVVILSICFALITVACSTTNNNGNCNAQGGNNGVTCIQSGNPAVGSSTDQTPSVHPSATKLDFVPQSSGPVSWCSIFYIKVSGQLPNGYKILIFDASADWRFLVTSNYNYDGAATSLTGVPNEWLTGHVWIASEYKQDASRHNIIRNGEPVSNAGYTAAVFAVLVPNKVSQKFTHVDVQVDHLPPGRIAEAQFNATRNGDVQGCSPPAG